LINSINSQLLVVQNQNATKLETMPQMKPQMKPESTPTTKTKSDKINEEIDFFDCEQKDHKALVSNI